MKIAMAIAIGGLTSAAWAAPKPLCYYFVTLATVLFMVLKEMP